MVSVMLSVMGGPDLAVADHVGMRHAVGGGRPVAEGKYGRRRHEAKGGKDREQNREPKAQADP
jgi:hypothetical protein